MPCRQVSTFNGTAASSGSYRTEAECNEACKEGACCDGATCTVKPQCQCKCASNSCCGPDTMTVNGITGPRCRGGTKSECDARGGTWRPCIGCSADAANPNASICRSTDTPSPAQPVEPVFQGVGTVCSPNPCVVLCPCPSGTQDQGAMPQAIHVSVSVSGGCYSVVNTYPITGDYSEHLDCAEAISLSQNYTLARVRQTETRPAGYVYSGRATTSSSTLMAYISITTSVGRISDPNIGGFLDAESCYFYLSVANPVQSPLSIPSGRRIAAQVSRANFFGVINGAGKSGTFCMGAGNGSGTFVEPGFDVTSTRTASTAYLNRSISGSFSIIGAE